MLLVGLTGGIAAGKTVVASRFAEHGAVVVDADAFLPVVPLADIERAGDTMVVWARVSRTTLAALGVPVDPARVTETVDTELLVRDDGSVLAVRFVF